MPVTDVTKDIERRTFAITAEFAAPVERVWALYAARRTGTSRRSTSRAASPSVTAWPTPTSTPTPSCRSRARLREKPIQHEVHVTGLTRLRGPRVRPKELLLQGGATVPVEARST